MDTPLHIIYLTGFGNARDGSRLKALRWWRFKGVTVEMLPMRWEGKETFEQKLIRVDKAIDRAAGKRIVLLGESAGGSMAVHAYARRADDLHKVLTVCGKNSKPETVSQEYFDRSPAFRTSMERLDASIGSLSVGQRRRFVSVHPLYDPTVPVAETLIPGCQRVRLWSAGHSVTIFLALTAFSPIVVRHARR